MSTPSVQNAARLVYKALHAKLSPMNDLQYRELLVAYRADSRFAADVAAVAAGLELTILDASERGLIVAPASRDSKFALRADDIRKDLKPDQKAGLVLAHIAVSSVFFPTTHGLEDDNYIPAPATVAQFRDALQLLARNLKSASENLEEIPADLTPGWAAICKMPVGITANTNRVGVTSVTGLISMALSHMTAGSLIRLDREDTNEDMVTYTATHRLRVQLKDLALRRIFELAQKHIGAQ